MSHKANKEQKSEVINTTQLFIHFSDFIKGLKKLWWAIIILAIVVSGYKVYNLNKNYVPFYSSTATVTVSTQRNTSAVNGIAAYEIYYDATTVNQLIKTFPHIINSDFFRDAVCEDLDIPVLPATLSVASDTGSTMFTITATGTEPQRTYDTLISAIENYPIAAKPVVGNIKLNIVADPVVATAPLNELDHMSYIKEALKGAVMGVLAGLALVFLYAIQRKTIKVKKEVTAQLNCDALGVVPQVKFKTHNKAIDSAVLFTNSNVGSGFMESFRVLRNRVVHSLDEGEKVIMGTSTAPSEGKTTVITNLALSLGSYGKNILLIDADLRNPSVAKLLGIDPNGINYEIETETYKIARLENKKISYMNIKSGKNYHDAINTKKIKQLLTSVRDDYDYILVDTPPCGLVSDALYIAQASDATIYIIQQDSVRVSRIRSALDGIMSTNTKMLGCVINNAKIGFTGYGYNNGYGYGYGYGYGKSSYKKYGYGYGHSDKKESRRR